MKLSLPRLSVLRPNKTWLVLGVSLLVGLSVMLITRGYLEGKIAAIEARSQTETTALLVVKRDLKRGDLLSTDNVAVRPIPLDYAHSNAIGPDDFHRIEGQAIERDLKSGEMLFWSLMQAKKAPTFSSRIEVGRRAITVQVDEINSISGLLEPGDAIDLMLTLDKSGKKTTFPLLQNVSVMATGQRAVDDPKSGERRQYSTVTLDTTREQAQSVIIAREAGKITALLRNPQDSQVLAGDSAAMAALLSQAGDVQSLVNTSEPAISEPPERKIPVLYGGRQSDFKPGDLMLHSPAGQRGEDEPALRAAQTKLPPVPP